MTSRADILIAWQHGGNLGHLGRLLPVAQGLRARGRTVLFAVADAAAAARHLEPAGFEWVAIPVPVAVPVEGQVLNHAGILLRCGFADAADAVAAQVREWQALFRATQARVLLADAAPLALYAAHAAALPVLALGHGFEVPPALPGLNFAPWLPAAREDAAATEKRLAHALEALARHLDAPAAPRSLGELFPGQSCVLCTWEELDHFDRPGQPAYVGPVWGDLAQGPQVGFKRTEGPKVLAYLNLIDKRYDLLWQALTASGAEVLVLSPGGTPWAHDAARGWGVEVVDHPVDLAPLLAHADAVVNHGGMATCSMALLAGKPLLVLPQNAEQGILAHRLARRALATATVRLRDKANMQQRAQALLDDSPRAAVAALATRYRGYTPAAAVDSIASRLAAF